ncbi:MAG: hypothetical protein ACYTF6_02865 [Planctomycetota bacterium]|jgi:hypothetical protein
MTGNTGGETRDSSGGGTFRILTIAILLAIIGGAVALGIYGFVSPRTEDNPRASQKLWFKCTKCKKEFEIPRGEYQEWANKVKPEGKNFGRAHCPGCKAKFSGARMPVCPNPECLKPYTHEQARRAATKKGADAEEICPHCGCDLLSGESRREQR